MRSAHHHLGFSFTLSVAVVGLIGCAAAAADYAVYVVDPPVNNRPVLADKPLPPTCRPTAPGAAVQITACRGEYEPMSFVVETQQPLRKVDVKVSPLKGKAGEIPGAAVDVCVVAPVFRRITHWPGAVNWVLVHDPDLILMKDEPEEAALKEDAPPVHKALVKTMVFTRRPVDTAALQPADVQARQQFWLTVHVPNDAAAGVYVGAVAILAENARPRKLMLELTVPDFDLEPPKAEYSIYHPAWLEGGGIAVDNPQGYTVLSEQQYLNDLRNMVAHGCLNPTIYTNPAMTPDGDLDFTVFAKVLDLRDQAGIPRSLALYLNGAGRINSSQKVNAEQKSENTRLTRQLVNWVRRRGHKDVYLMGADEATGEALMCQKDAWESIRQGGGKIFVAHYAGYTEGIGHLLDLPIMLHPALSGLDKFSMMPADEFLRFPKQVREAVGVRKVLEESCQQKLRQVHSRGHRLFTYMDPSAGRTFPEVHRRIRGLALWKAGIDGTMTWSYAHITNSTYTQAGLFKFSSFNFVLRGAEAPFDSLSWEAYREGYDDARYAATLEAALRDAGRSAQGAALIGDTVKWLEELDVVDGDLGQIRLEMVRRITALRKLARQPKAR